VPEKLLARLPEAFVSTSATAVLVSRAVKAGDLRKLGSRLYTRNLTDDPVSIIRRNLWQIVGGYFPGGLIADRTALENAPASEGSVCLVSPAGGDIALPGLRLRPRRGVAPLDSDRPFIGGLALSSTARAYLENMRVSRTRGDVLPRTLSPRELEERLDTLLRRSGQETFNKLRDDVRTLAPKLAMQDEADALDDLMGALLGTRDTHLVAPTARARQKGRPYDPERVALFEGLRKALRDYPPVSRVAKSRPPEGQATLAFFEAYFSNFIEGTEFAVEEAADIVFRGVIPNERPEDAHDVLGTFRTISDTADLSRLPTRVADMLEALRRRHAAIMESRVDKGPGRFKSLSNRAGATLFVAPDLVEGTLEQGFSLYRSLETPFSRAVFMMFLIAEVHPFADGNGRTARIMMNAELIAAGEERIVIPTVYRLNYLSALKALSQTGHPEALIRTLDYAQRWIGSVQWRALSETQRDLENCNAFIDPGRAEEEGLRLRMP
jgi:fido (protein-threonine AMPylation protein)